MKKLLVGLVLSFAVLAQAGVTNNVPGTYSTIAEALAASTSGDEVVVAAGVYPQSAALTVPIGVTLRGATGNREDVVIDGQGKTMAGITVNSSGVLKDFTIKKYVGTCVSFTAWNSAQGMVNVRITEVSGTGYNGRALNSNGGYLRNCQIDNITGGGLSGGTFINGSGLTIVDCVFSNSPNWRLASSGETQTARPFSISGTPLIRNCLFADIGITGAFVPSSGNLVTGNATALILWLSDKGTVSNCVFCGGYYRGGESTSGIGAIRMGNNPTVIDSVIVMNGNGVIDSNWIASKPTNIKNCLTTQADQTTSGLEYSRGGGDFFWKPGELPWIPYGSRAIGAGITGGTIGQIYVPTSLKCGINADRTVYAGNWTAHLTAVASAQATFAWTVVSGGDNGTLTTDGAAATFVFSKPGTTVIRATANGTASDTIMLVSGDKTLNVNSTGVEKYTTVEAALADAVDGAEIVVATGTYTPAATLEIDKAVTIRSLTGNRDDVILSGNNARRVAHLYNGKAVLADLTVAYGKNSNPVAGVWIDGGGTLTNVVVRDCTQNDGWQDENEYQRNYVNGVAVHNRDGLVVDCVIANNKRTTNHAGATAFGQGGKATLTDRCLITNNVNTSSGQANAAYAGAPVMIANGVLRNTIVAYNDLGSANTKAGTVDASGVKLIKGRLENCTIFRNYVNASALSLAPGLRQHDNANAFVYNTLVIENGAKGGDALNWILPKPGNFVNGATAPLPDNAVDSVLFTGAPYILGEDGLPTMQGVAPSVDAGTALYAGLEWIAGGIDQRHEPRSQGAAVDIGAWEYEPPAFGVSITVTPDVLTAFDRIEAILTAVPEGSSAGATYRWDLDGDGYYETDTGTTPSVGYTNTTYGATTVGVRAVSASEVVATDEKVFTVNPSRHYIKPVNPQAQPPYATPETAGTNIQEAINLAVAGATVVLAKGTYAPEATLTLTTPVTLRGATGNRDDVVITGSAGHRLLQVGNPDAVVSSLTISGGRYGSYGAGVYINGGGTLTNVTVTGCVQTGSWFGSDSNTETGAAVMNYNGRLVDCSVSNNRRGQNYNGSVAYGQNGSDAVADRCVFTNNINTATSQSSSSDVYKYSAAPLWIKGGVVRNSMIAYNNVGLIESVAQVSDASGVKMQGGRIENCTIFRNHVDASGLAYAPGLRLYSGAKAYNVLVIENGPEGGETLNYVFANAADFVNGATAPLPDGATDAVLFAGEPYVLGADALPRMKGTAPSIDAGTTAYAGLGWIADGLDLARAARVQGEAVDIGAFEYAPPAFAVALSSVPDVTTAFDSLSVTLTTALEGDTAGTTFRWDLDGDGVYETDTGSTGTVDYEQTDFGSVTVGVKATNGAALEATDARTFTVNPSVLYVSDGNAAAEPPYATWATAASNIQDAVNAAAVGAKVKVAAGTYRLVAPVLIEKGVTVEGTVGDWNAVQVTPDWSHDPEGTLFIVKTSGATLSYLTLTNACNRNRGLYAGSGACVYNAGPNVIEHCRLTGFFTQNTWGGPAGIYNNGGTVRDCRFDHATFSTHTPPLYVQEGVSALMDRCTFDNLVLELSLHAESYKDGGCRIGAGAMRNSLVTGCRMTSFETRVGRIGFIRADGGTVENCAVFGNEFPDDGYVTAVRLVSGAARNLLVAENGGLDLAGSGFSHCCVTNAAAYGADNVEYVAGTSRVRKNGKLVMRSDTPCYDAGLYDGAWMDTATDLYGTPRVHTPGKVDIGPVSCVKRGFLLLVK